MAKNILTITFGPKLLVFSSEQEWIDHGRSWFSAVKRDHRLPREALVSVDAKGRICAWGAHFRRATLEGTYPITVYAVDDFEGN